jgi:tetratricopeptide (TPR) repeat protein
VSFGLRAVIADQLYLWAWPSHPERLELAARIFPYERAIAISPGYFYLLANKPSLKALHEVRKALEWDNGAADLIQAEMVYSFAMGKTDEAVAAFYRLKRIDPDAPAIKRMERSDEP